MHHRTALLSLQVKHLPVNGYVELSKERSFHVLYGCRFFIQVKLALADYKNVINLFTTCQFSMIGCGTNLFFRFSIQIRIIGNHTSFAEKGLYFMAEDDRSFFHNLNFIVGFCLMCSCLSKPQYLNVKFNDQWQTMGEQWEIDLQKVFD